jgi:hypothetical protein
MDASGEGERGRQRESEVGARRGSTGLKTPHGYSELIHTSED